MNWSSYEVFAVIGGLVMLAIAVPPLLEVKERLLFAVSGVLFAGYGFYVAAQDSGSFVFPVMIYLFPIGAVARAAQVWNEGRKSGTGTSRTDDPA